MTTETEETTTEVDADAVREEGRTAGLADGAKAANERAAKILAAARKAGVSTEFAATLVASDKSLEECLMAILDERPTTPAPTSSSNDPNPETEGLFDLSSEAANESDPAERLKVLKERYKATPKLREQFASAEAYAGYVDGMANGGLRFAKGGN